MLRDACGTSFPPPAIIAGRRMVLMVERRVARVEIGRYRTPGSGNVRGDETCTPLSPVIILTDVTEAMVAPARANSAGWTRQIVQKAWNKEKEGVPL